MSKNKRFMSKPKKIEHAEYEKYFKNKPEMEKILDFHDESEQYDKKEVKMQI